MYKWFCIFVKHFSKLKICSNKNCGIDVGEIRYLVQIAPLISTEFVPGDDGYYHEVKKWSNQYRLATVQTVILLPHPDCPVKTLQKKSFADSFIPESVAFLCGGKNYYGRAADINYVDRSTEKGKIGSEYYIKWHLREFDV